MTERELLAAEHALGLLEGEALVEARALVASDPAFAAEVGQWSERLAPLFEETPDVPAPATAWARIETELTGGDPGGEVVALRRRLRAWQWATGLASAAAAALLVVAVPNAVREPGPTAPVAARPAPVMVARLMDDDRQMMLSAAWQPANRMLMVAPGRMAADAGHSHELWIIPADGKPRSLGIIAGDAPRRMAVPAALMHNFADGAMLAISVEPAGGSPTQGPTGPVVASGALSAV